MNQTTTIKVYTYTAEGLYIGAVDHPRTQPMPPRTTVAPAPAPTLLQPYVVYVGGGWELRATPPTDNVYDRGWDFGWYLTTNAFAQRFTFSEQVEIEKAKDGVGIYATAPYAPYVYPLKALMAALDRASFSDLTDPLYADAMQLLHALGIITAERADVIINTKASWKELPQWRQVEMLNLGYVPQ